MAKVKFNKPTIYTVGEVSLISGVNDVPDKFMKDFLDHPHVQHKIKAGLIEVVGKKAAKDETEETSDEVSFEGKKVGEILEAIPETTDLAALEGLLSHKSEKVQTAALARIEELQADEGQE